MGQWGVEKTVDGVRLLPHVCTPAFEPAEAESIIDGIYILDIGGMDMKEASKILEWERDKHVGKPYHEWLNIILKRRMGDDS